MTSNSVGVRVLRDASPRRKRTWHELSVAMLLLLEISLVVPWLRAISSSASQLSTWQVMLLLMIHAYMALYASRLLDRFNLGGGLRVIILFGLFTVSMALTLWVLVVGSGEALPDPGGALQSLAAMLIGSSNGLVVILSVLFAWWRGLLAASAETVGMQATGLRFRLGVLTMGLFGVVFLRTKAEYLLEVLPLFIGSALLAMALSRADTLESTSGFGRTPFTTGWLVAIVAIVGIMLLAGFVVNAFLQTPLARELATWFVIALVMVAAIVLSPVLLILYYLFSFGLTKLFEWLQLDSEAIVETDGVSALQGLIQQLQEEAVREAPVPSAWWTENAWLVQTLLIVLGISILVIVVMRIGRRVAARREELELVEGEDLLSSRSLMDGMRRGLERAREMLNIGNMLRSVRREIAASSIRRVYARLLDLAEKRGRARKPSETPEEFLEGLYELFPDHHEQSAEITRAYVLVRYGEFPEDLVHPGRVFRSWRAIRDGARGRGSARKEPQEDLAQDGDDRGNDE